jgi:transposase
MERSIEEIIEDNEEISEHTEDTVDTEEEVTEAPVVSAAIQRPKKERTQKQKDALEKARETRTRNIAAKKAQKSEPLTVPVTKQKNPKPKKKQQVIILESSSSSEDEAPIVIRHKKKKKKKVVYQPPPETSSSEEEEEYYENQPPTYQSYASQFRFV